MNIFVDPNIGHVTGIIDWAEAIILPFGISLWGLENILGYMDSQGWHYYKNYQKLEKLFWKTLRRLLESRRATSRLSVLRGWLASSCAMVSSGRIVLEKYLRRSQIHL
jgi:hypothetical protein